jgi:hypothetical protein
MVQWVGTVPTLAYSPLASPRDDTRTLQAFMGHRSIANTVIYTVVADNSSRRSFGRVNWSRQGAPKMLLK